MENIAIFGGSFDPLHFGHTAIVDALLKLKYIDKVIIVPTYLNPFKKSFHLSAEKRYKVLVETFKEYENVEVSDYEIKLKQSVPTIQTVKFFHTKYKKIYLVIGADNLHSFHKWKDYEELIAIVDVIVATRNGIKIPKEFTTLKIDKKISSTQIRREQMKQRIENIVASLDKNKAESIEVFDLREKEYFVDYAIIASSLGSKHTVALLDHLKKDIKPQETFNNVDESTDWIVVDLGDILIHIMTPEYRVKYDMESFLNSLKNSSEES